MYSKNVCLILSTHSYLCPKPSKRDISQLWYEGETYQDYNKVIYYSAQASSLKWSGDAIISFKFIKSFNS